MTNKPDTLSRLTLAILGLISQHPQSGYDIRRTFSQTPMGSFSSSPGAIYPALKRIESNGWIEVQPEAGTHPRHRQIYRLTAAGRATLIDALNRPVTREDVIWNPDYLLLRFAFMEGLVGMDVITRFLRQFRTELTAHLGYLEGYYADYGKAMPLTGRLAMENGIRGYRSNLEWTASALQALATRPDDLHPHDQPD